MNKIYFRNKKNNNLYANNRVNMLTGETTLTDKNHAMVFNSDIHEAEEMLAILNKSRDRFELELELDKGGNENV